MAGQTPGRSLTPAKLPVLDVELAEDPAELEAEDRRAEAWAMAVRGQTQAAIARRFDVSRQTINKWLRQEAQRRRSVAQNIDDEAERLIGQLEAVAAEAWASHRRATASSEDALDDLRNGGRGNAMVGPQYLKLVIEAVERIAKYRGIDGPGTDPGRKGQVEVVVKIGGDSSAAVGVRAS